MGLYKYIRIDAKSIYKKYGESDNQKEDNQIVFDIFNKYQIPIKYQAIILKQSKKHIYEIITNQEFFKDTIATTKKGQNIVLGNFNNNILTFIKGTYEEYNNNDLINFLKEIKKEGISKEYLEAVKEIMTNQLVHSKKPFTFIKNKDIK